MKQGEEEAAEDDTNGLWNGEPFKPLPAVDVPDLPAGCARAMSLQVCTRPGRSVVRRCSAVVYCACCDLRMTFFMASRLNSQATLVV